MNLSLSSISLSQDLKIMPCASLVPRLEQDLHVVQQHLSYLSHILIGLSFIIKGRRIHTIQTFWIKYIGINLKAVVSEAHTQGWFECCFNMLASNDQETLRMETCMLQNYYKNAIIGIVTSSVRSHICDHKSILHWSVDIVACFFFFLSLAMIAYFVG